jgi:hypothetical protein
MLSVQSPGLLVFGTAFSYIFAFSYHGNLSLSLDNFEDVNRSLKFSNLRYLDGSMLRGDIR